MEEFILALAPAITFGLPYLTSLVRRKRRGSPPPVAAVELESGERIDISGPALSEVRTQVETVLDVASPVATENVRPALRTGFTARLNNQITPLQLVYGLVMIAGIVAKEIWDYNQKYGKPGFRLSSITGACIVAPIVYAAVQPHLAPLQESLTLIGICIAFQNGFFWQSVFATATQAAAPAH